jgi:alpha-L-rhamnosidase
MLGDTRIAADHYPNLQLYIAFMTSSTNSSGVAHIEQSYGDWCPPGPMPPKSYTSGVSFIVDMHRIIEIATALGKTQDAATYSNYLNNFLVPGFNAAWLNATLGTYGFTNGDGLQTANAAAIFIGAAKAAGPTALTNVGAALVKDVVDTHASHFSTGIIGMRYLHASLVQVGAGDAALDTLLQVDYPSYGFEMYHPLEPATTLWELLDGPTEGPG